MTRNERLVYDSVVGNTTLERVHLDHMFWTVTSITVMRMMELCPELLLNSPEILGITYGTQHYNDRVK